MKCLATWWWTTSNLIRTLQLANSTASNSSRSFKTARLNTLSLLNPFKSKQWLSAMPQCAEELFKKEEDTSDLQGLEAVREMTKEGWAHQRSNKVWGENAAVITAGHWFHVCKICKKTFFSEAQA